MRTIASALGIPVRIPARKSVVVVSTPPLRKDSAFRKKRLKPNCREFCRP
jgi:hypothetical protein